MAEHGEILEPDTDPADGTWMAGTDVADRTTSLRVLRVVAAVGSAGALGLVVIAFSAGWLIGALALGVAPVIPLLSVLMADQLMAS